MYKHPIDFANAQCDRYYLHRVHRDLLGLLGQWVLNYLQSRAGCCWIFYNSDIQIFDDEGKYDYRYGEEFLDPKHLTVLVKAGYGYWEKRVNCPGLTTEENASVLMPIKRHLDTNSLKYPDPELHLAIWSLLLWHASPSPDAIGWRKNTYQWYARGLVGNYVTYGNQTISLDELDLIDRQKIKCAQCRSMSACVTITQPNNTPICGKCLGSGECRVCTRACGHNQNYVENNSIEKCRFPFLTKSPKGPLIAGGFKWKQPEIGQRLKLPRPSFSQAGSQM